MRYETTLTAFRLTLQVFLERMKGNLEWSQWKHKIPGADTLLESVEKTIHIQNFVRYKSADRVL